ncbi:MAG: aminopeptidase P family protein [Gudongella sp.]|jgi:Xaa-Pro aminopeptidase|nr:aminopeptidase P family protein [Gudongella sp.]
MSNQNLKELRDLMKERGIDVYIEPTSDPHQSEYVAPHYKGRDFLTGFTGSAGMAVVTMEKAILWTDGRYFIQAENQLKGSGFELYKMHTPGFPSYQEWLKENLKEKSVIGVNGEIVSEGFVEEILDKLESLEPLIYDGEDLVGLVWVERPGLPKGKVIKLDIRYSGESTEKKIEKIREDMVSEGADIFLLGSLDDIAWLFNIRGSDIKNNPVVISYAVVTRDQAILFVDSEKVDETTKEYLKLEGVNTMEYEEIFDFVSSITDDKVIVLEKGRVNRKLYSAIPEECEIIDVQNLTSLPKAIKNEVEIENQRLAYTKDCVALTKFFYWLDNNISSAEITEYDAALKLLGYREQIEGFQEPSFDTIAAYGENAAMMHYSATKDNHAILKPKGLFLLDSGGQYFEGTTDITRTVALGELTDEEKRDFTLVLKGHINLISAKFLQGTSGHALDVLARYPLWQEGEDYKSGTGHGVGYYLNVHEGPHRISTAPNNVALEPGMIVTIEPGIYKGRMHGIRIENVAVVAEDVETYVGQFYKFDILSWCYIDPECINPNMLSEIEKDWVNNYNMQVYLKLSPFLTDNQNAWLKDKTRKI